MADSQAAQPSAGGAQTPGTATAPSTPDAPAAKTRWHLSRYNLQARLPHTDDVVIANLMRGTCRAYSPFELFLIGMVEDLPEGHPALDLLGKTGVICDYDELALLETRSRIASADSELVSLTICPTLGCNFDCPYCFEDHSSGTMSAAVQDQVVDLVRRILETTGAKRLHVVWFGGEPLLAPEVIETLSDRFVSLAEQFGADYGAGIVTNGYLLTQQVADMLGRARVASALVSLDGMGAAHDATRHLAGGGPTFERIASNLRELKLPFIVNLRHNVQQDNLQEREGLKAYVGRLARESGNDLRYYPATVWSNEAADGRGERLGIIHGDDELSVRLEQDAPRFGVAGTVFCGAHRLWSIGIDHLGNLYKCWEAVDKPRYSFGHVASWDPADPLGTAKNRDLICYYLSKSSPFADAECRSCVWLPHCVGSCPHKALFGQGRSCVPYRDDPERFVLAVYGLTCDDNETSGER